MITDRLFELQDTAYKDFSAALMPTVNPDTVIGVRAPELRRLAKELSGNADEFLKSLPHRYYEENNLHGYLISLIKDYDKAIAAVEEFLPFIDNWATCDTLSPPVFAKFPDRLMEHVRVWLNSGRVYTVRFGMGMLMRYYLDENFRPEYPELVLQATTDDYYIHMMTAWYFATALAKRYDEVLPFFENRRLPKKTHNKAIAKAVESFRVTPEHKEHLKILRIK